MPQLTTFTLTKEGIIAAAQAKKDGTLAPGNLPVRVRRENVKEALAFYWGRGIPLDPSHLTWTLKENTH